MYGSVAFPETELFWVDDRSFGKKNVQSGMDEPFENLSEWAKKANWSIVRSTFRVFRQLHHWWDFCYFEVCWKIAQVDACIEDQSQMLFGWVWQSFQQYIWNAIKARWFFHFELWNYLDNVAKSYMVSCVLQWWCLNTINDLYDFCYTIVNWVLIVDGQWVILHELIG